MESFLKNDYAQGQAHISDTRLFGIKFPEITTAMNIFTSSNLDLVEFNIVEVEEVD